jgi:hypothetical protein
MNSGTELVCWFDPSTRSPPRAKCNLSGNCEEGCKSQRRGKQRRDPWTNRAPHCKCWDRCSVIDAIQFGRCCMECRCCLRVESLWLSLQFVASSERMAGGGERAEAVQGVTHLAKYFSIMMRAARLISLVRTRPCTRRKKQQQQAAAQERQGRGSGSGVSAGRTHACCSLHCFPCAYHVVVVSCVQMNQRCAGVSAPPPAEAQQQRAAEKRRLRLRCAYSVLTASQNRLGNNAKQTDLVKTAKQMRRERGGGMQCECIL